MRSNLRGGIPGSLADSPLGGAWIMLIFGLGTVPAIFTISSSVSPAFTRFQPWRWSGAFILTVGALLILRGTAALGIVPHTIFWVRIVMKQA